MAQQLDWAVIPNKVTITDVLPQDFHYYDLYNVTTSEALRYGERTWGINLTWTDPAKSDNIRFQRNKIGKEAIVYGEHVAIHIRSGGYLVYQSGRRGINLGWSDTPKFEWVLKGGVDGAAIHVGTTIGLFNLVENDYLMYESRDWGINLKWLKDSGKYNTISDAIKLGKKWGPEAIKIAALVG